jgi:hypothetical protein
MQAAYAKGYREALTAADADLEQGCVRAEILRLVIPVE